MTRTLPNFQQINDRINNILSPPPQGAVVVGIAIPPDRQQIAVCGPPRLSAVDGSDLILNEHTPFAIGSISKTFTATLYARAVYENSLASSATLDNCLGGYFANHATTTLLQGLKNTTLRSLATYSSGLPQDDGHPILPSTLDKPPYTYTLNDFLTYLSGDPRQLVSPGQEVQVKLVSPGQYAYSNLGFALLGAALANSLGGTYASVLRSFITGPLGVNFDTLDNVLPSVLPRSYQLHGAPAPFDEGRKQYPAYNPAGGLVVSGSDFLMWLQYNLGALFPQNPGPLPSLLAQLLSPSGVTTSTSDKPTSMAQQVGLAWHRDPAKNLWFKDGGTLGFSSFVTISPAIPPGQQQSAGVFIFANFKPPRGAIATAAARIWDIINNTNGTQAVETSEI